MRIRLQLGTYIVAGLIAYMVSPYVAVMRLQSAMESGDTQTLERMVDWRSVRDGLKSDINAGIIGLASTQLGANTLPPFGSGFMSGIADTTIDREVTPQNLVAVMRQMRPEHSAPASIDCVLWAFFKGPTSFEMVVRSDSDGDEDQHLRLRLELHGMHWSLVRAWVPQDLIERATQRT